MNLLTILLALAALRLAKPPLAAYLAAPALFACAYAGLTFPDIDQPLPLDHRSALTHGIAPALALTAWPWARAAAAGLSFGVGLHLAADIFPNAMTGYATVAVPFAGRLDAGGSYLWLIANAAACAALGLWLLVRALPHAAMRAAALLGVALIGLSYLPSVDGGWPALLILLCAGWLGVRGRLPRLPGRATARP